MCQGQQGGGDGSQARGGGEGETEEGDYFFSAQRPKGEKRRGDIGRTRNSSSCLEWIV